MSERFANVETVVEFVKKYTPCINGETTMECVERSIRNAPTIEAKPVVHAYWEPENYYYRCSNCGETAFWDLDEGLSYPYCPFCGAQMDEFAGDTNVGSKAVKIPVISMEDVPKIMEEMENNA